MGDRAKKLRQRKLERKQAKATTRKPARAAERPAEGDQWSSEAPTPQQIAKGTYEALTGDGKKRVKYVNKATDMIGVLHMRSKITDDEESAARTFQDVRNAYLATLDVSAGRSCIDMTPVGQGVIDDEHIAREYNALRDRLGGRDFSFVAGQVEKPARQRCDDLRRLRVLLRKIVA